MTQSKNFHDLRKKLEKRLIEFRKYRFANGKTTKKSGLFSKIFN